MRNVIPLIIILSICSTAWAQTTITAGPQLAMPSNFSKASKIGLGASAEGVFNFNKVSAFRVSAGYYSFKGKFFPEIVSFVPVRGGYQYFLSTNQLFLSCWGLRAQPCAKAKGPRHILVLRSFPFTSVGVLD